MNARKSVCQRELGVGRLSWPFVQSSTLQCFICNLKKALIHPYSNFLGVFVWGGRINGGPLLERKRAGQASSCLCPRQALFPPGPVSWVSPLSSLGCCLCPETLHTPAWCTHIHTTRVHAHAHTCTRTGWVGVCRPLCVCQCLCLSFVVLLRLWPSHVSGMSVRECVHCMEPAVAEIRPCESM